MYGPLTNWKLPVILNQSLPSHMVPFHSRSQNKFNGFIQKEQRLIKEAISHTEGRRHSSEKAVCLAEDAHYERNDLTSLKKVASV